MVVKEEATEVLETDLQKINSYIIFKWCEEQVFNLLFF